MNEYVNAVKKLRGKMWRDELLAGLAEEAAELAQAALKYRRAIHKENPTPVTEEQARDALLEEFADVMQYCDLLKFPEVGEWDKVDATKRRKLRRFLERLEGRADV